MTLERTPRTCPACGVGFRRDVSRGSRDFRVYCLPACRPSYRPKAEPSTERGRCPNCREFYDRRTGVIGQPRLYCTYECMREAVSKRRRV